MHSRKKRKQKNKLSTADSGPVELNVMPFIDVFSLLTTFLLFSAVFIQIGIIEVQVPFFTNKPQSDEKEEDKRKIQVHVTLEDKTIEVETFYSLPPRNAQKNDFSLDERGIQEMHEKLVSIRTKNPDTDKVTLFVDDEITYETVVEVVDAIKILGPDDPEIPQSEDTKDGSDSSSQTNLYLFPKVVMGSVLL